MKTLVLGGSGMLGHALRDRLEAVYVGSEQADLRDDGAAYNLFAEVQPDVVIHCAARVGGIKDNSENQYKYFEDNARINLNVVAECVRRGVPKLIAISSTCCYPAKCAEYPIEEEALHGGPPHWTNFGYAFAKRMMQVQIDAACRPNWSVIYPSNLYGPHDTFDEQRSHVIPALMMRMHKAKAENMPFINLMGSGRALRQFTFTPDLARFIAHSLRRDIDGGFTIPSRVNFAGGDNHGIAAVAEMIAAVVGYAGELRFAHDDMDGVDRKDVSIFNLRRVYKDAFTPLHDGLERTYKWYLQSLEVAA